MHMKYFPVSLGMDERHDIRDARPLYTWNSVTGRYTVVDNINVRFEVVVLEESGAWCEVNRGLHLIDLVW
jgi:hypothetical protein